MVFSFCFIPISSMLFSGKTDAILLSLHASLGSMPVHLLLFPLAISLQTVYNAM